MQAEVTRLYLKHLVAVESDASLEHRDSPSVHHKNEGSRMAATKAELNRYFEMINRRVPRRVAQSIKWLRKPSSFAVRLIVAIALILGGIFSFLPVLGLWMLPLGLLFISQDLPFLQKPLITALAWMETKWKLLKLRWKNKQGSSV